MIFVIFWFAVGLVLLVWPHAIINRAQRRRAERLAELQSGANEQFFEERRSLESYPITTSPDILRLVGMFVIMIALARLISNGF